MSKAVNEIVEFQSTLPVWGATAVVGVHKRVSPRYFNPRSPCGERPGILPAIGHDIDFNPRSPCGERPATAPACGW